MEYIKSEVKTPKQTIIKHESKLSGVSKSDAKSNMSGKSPRLTIVKKEVSSMNLR